MFVFVDSHYRCPGNLVLCKNIELWYFRKSCVLKFSKFCFHLLDSYASFATYWLQFCKYNGPACLFRILLCPCLGQKSSVDFPTILWQWHWHELWQHVRTLHQMQQRDGWVRDDAFLTDLISRHLAQLIADKKVHYVWPKESDVTRGGRLKDWLLTAHSFGTAACLAVAADVGSGASNVIDWLGVWSGPRLFLAQN